MLQKRYVRFLSVLLSLAFLAFTGCTNSQEQIPVSTPGTPVVQAEASEPEQSQTSNREDGAPFSLTMLDVGQGLSILVQADGEYLLYDGGGRGASSYVVAYLQQHAVTELEWLAASHYTEPISREKSLSIQMVRNVGSARNPVKTGAPATKPSLKSHSPQLYRRPHSMC